MLTIFLPEIRGNKKNSAGDSEPKDQNFSNRELLHQKSREKENPIDFKIGDYVLVADNDKKLIKWNALAQVLRIDSEWAILIKYTHSGETEIMHPNRLKFFCFKQDLTPETIRIFEDIQTENQGIHSIIGARIIERRKPTLQLHIKYLPSKEAPNGSQVWFPFKKVFKMTPHLVKRYVAKLNHMDPITQHLSKAILDNDK